MTQHKFGWVPGKLDKGFTSFAEHLGEDPANVVFMNSCVVNPKGKSWAMAFALDENIITTLSGPGSTALLFPLTKSEKAYVDAYLAEGDLIPVKRLGDSMFYPDLSAVAALLKQEHDPFVQKVLKGKVIVNSYTTEEVELLAEKMGGRTIMSCDTFLKFGGKDYLHKMATEEGFDVPPGFVIPSAPASASAMVDTCRENLVQLGVNPDTTNIWIKASSLGSGIGVVDKPNAKTDSLLEAFTLIAQEYRNFGFYGDPKKCTIDPRDPFKGIINFIPIVVEIDVGRLHNVKRKLDDVGVNAIISDKQVVHLASLPFAAPNGEYMGSRLPGPEDARIVFASEVQADILLQRMWREGYRGYVGIDAMVVEEHSGEIKAYLNDINTRLCGASPLIAMAHKAEAKLGKSPVGFSLKSHSIPLPEKCDDVYAAALALLGNHLYRGAESGYTGIVPVGADVRPPHTDCLFLRSMMIARDNQHLRELRNVVDSLGGNTHITSRGVRHNK